MHEPSQHLHIEEDEINLLDYLIILLKHKWLIAGAAFAAGLIAMVVSLIMPNIYRAEVTIMPRQQEPSPASSALSALGGLGGLASELVGLGSSGDVKKLEVVLKSRKLAHRVVEKYKLLPNLFRRDWDPTRKEWRDNPTPTVQDAYKLITEDMLAISRDRKSDALTISFDHDDPKFAKEMVDYYLTQLSESLREETLKDAAENKRFLQQQLEKTFDVLLKDKISTLLAREIEKETLARAQKYYSFIVLDPPVVPDLDKKIKPRRTLICILSVIAAGFAAVFAAFFIEYVHNVRHSEDEEKLQRLRKYWKLRSPGQ